MEKKKSRKDLIFYDSIISIVAAFGVEFLYPPFLPIVIAMKSFGFGGIAYYVLTYSKFDRVFKNCGLNIDLSYPILKALKGKKHTEYGSELYYFTLPCGLCETDFLDKQEAIENYLGCDIEIKYTFKEIQIEVFKNPEKEIIHYEPQELKGFVPIIIGYTRKGELITCDLGKGEPHMLIAGETGGGKSSAIRAIITNLILYNDVILHLIDLKSGVELRLFADSKKVASFSRTPERAKMILQQLEMEVDSRYNKFYKTRVKDIVEYNKKFPKDKMDYQLLVVDEFADLHDDAISKTAFEVLGRKARACGIHMILATQRPDAKVLNGAIKNNIPTALGLKTTDGTNSRIIIDDTCLKELKRSGQAFFKRGGERTLVQVPYLSDTEAEALIKHTYVEKNYSDNDFVVPEKIDEKKSTKSKKTSKKKQQPALINLDSLKGD